jgi:aspartate/methionine/tyrosine aminotransferase
VPKDPPHPILLSALAQSASDPNSAGYGTILGEPLLREALANEFNLMYQLPTSTATDQNGIGTITGSGLKKSEISITTGCNMAFLVLVMVLCPPGSKALMPLPAYFSQSMSLSLQSVEPIYIPCLPSSGFKPSLPAARRYLETDKEGGIRMIVLVTPSNPTGAIYTPQELKEWYDLAKEFGVALVLDETYRDFVDPRPENEREAPHDLFKIEGWQDTLISIGSMSSAYPFCLQPLCMTTGSYCVLCEATAHRTEGYRIPGHRLGTITASALLQESIAVVCDCMQVSPHPSRASYPRDQK